MRQADNNQSRVVETRKKIIIIKRVLIYFFLWKFDTSGCWHTFSSRNIFFNWCKILNFCVRIGCLSTQFVRRGSFNDYDFELRILLKILKQLGGATWKIPIVTANSIVAPIATKSRSLSEIFRKTLFEKDAKNHRFSGDFLRSQKLLRTRAHHWLVLQLLANFFHLIFKPYFVSPKFHFMHFRWSAQ